MQIEFPRGDSYEQGFLLKRGNEPDTAEYDEIYLTVKNTAKDREFKLQKRLSDHGIVSDGEGHYTVYFEPGNTDGMEFGEYVFDIELRKDTFCKTFVGKLILTPEVTHRNNE